MTATISSPARPDGLGAYRAGGWSTEQAVAAMSENLRWETAWHWQQSTGLSPDHVLAWWIALSGHSDLNAFQKARDWVTAGVRHPEQRPPGMSASATLMCLLAEVAPSPAWGPRASRALRALSTGAPSALWLCPTLVGEAARLGQRAEVAAGLLDALRPVTEDVAFGQCMHTGAPRADGQPGAQVTCGWLPEQVQAVQGFLRSLAGVDWADVTLCVQTGMSPEGAAEHVRAGCDMGPVRLLAALSG